MRKSKRSQLGATLTEAMLVITIGSAIIYLSIQQYLSYKKDSDAVEITTNVNQLFQAMGNYYRKNCYGTTDLTNTTDPINYGKLNPNPLNPSAPPEDADAKVAITVTELINEGFLDKPPKLTPLVDTSVGSNGFMLQFNKKVTTRKVCLLGSYNPYDTTCTSTKDTGESVSWLPQVAVKLKHADAASAIAFLNLLRGDCLSTESGGIVAPCTGGIGSGNYVVWQRLPSMASTGGAVSNYWGTTPTVALFTQMYTTAPITAVIDQVGDGDMQYYLCGN